MRSGFIREITGKFTIKVVERRRGTCKTKKVGIKRIKPNQQTNPETPLLRKITTSAICGTKIEPRI
jgi:hypothetical protein